MTESVNFGALLASVGSLSMDTLPQAAYDVKVIEAEAATSSTGKLMYKIRYEVISGTYVGRKVYNNITLTTDKANALRMFFVNMKAMGLEETFFATGPTPETVAQALIGKQCTITLTHQEYPAGSGQMKENVNSIKASAGVSAIGTPVMASTAPPITALVVAPAAPVVTAAPVLEVPVIVAAPVAAVAEPTQPVEVVEPASETATQATMPAPPPLPF